MAFNLDALTAADVLAPLLTRNSTAALAQVTCACSVACPGRRERRLIGAWEGMLAQAGQSHCPLSQGTKLPAKSSTPAHAAPPSCRSQ